MSATISLKIYNKIQNIVPTKAPYIYYSQANTMNIKFNGDITL